MPAFALKNLPGPGSWGARHTIGTTEPPHFPAACAARAVTAGMLTRGNFGPAPKSKSRMPYAWSTKKLKLNCLLIVDASHTYSPRVGDDRSLSAPQKVQVFFNAQLGPKNFREGPNSSSNTRS